jgi:serine/threonine-protein kinase
MEAILNDFEDGWKVGMPRIDDFLVRLVPQPSDGRRRGELLIELIRIDLEYRWRQAVHAPAGSATLPPRPHLEHYVASFSELGCLERLPLGLIGDEYRVRQRWGDRPTHAEYAARFATDGLDLAASLAQIDAELARDNTAAKALRVPEVTVLDTRPLADCIGSSPGEERPDLPDYEILGELGHGGMGVVYKARQRSLKRLVALKVILPGQHLDPDNKIRFRREAEAAACLQHPNIVQVFEVGEHAGCPYLALELVEGPSLKEQLNDKPLAPAQAAHLVEALARAMQYAHEHGIVHRDLKPANILLAGCGLKLGGKPQVAESIPKITDFGLAKQLDSGEGLTRSGAVVGTPSYMSPEQASGALEGVGPASDVYSLGATLYESLTGQPPFQAATTLDTLDLVRKVDPVPPRRLQPKVPRDLETICLKCLEKEPRKRYATAAGLAEDLGRFLANKPILARPARPWERGWKWARRNRALSAALGVLALCLAVVFGVVLSYNASLRTTVAEKEEALRQKDIEEARARRQRERADDNYQDAKETVDQIVELIDRFYASGPKIETLRRNVRTKALGFYEKTTRHKQDVDDSIRLDIAKAHVHIAQWKPGEPDEAHKNLLTAQQILDELCAQEPANRVYQAELANCWDNLGTNAAYRGDRKECRRCREQALAMMTELCRAEPNNAAWQRKLAASHLNVGNCCAEADDLTKTEAHWREAVRIMEELLKQHPEEASYQHLLAICSTNLALLYADTGRLADSLKLYSRAAAWLDHLVQAHSEEWSWRFNLVETLRLWGRYLIDAGRGEEARTQLTRAILMAQDMVREDPLHPTLPGLLLACYVLRMNSFTLLRRWKEGEADWQRSMDQSQRRNSWWELCSGVRRDAQLGAYQLATARASQVARKCGLRAKDRYELGKAYGAAIKAASADGHLAPTGRQQMVERFSKEAFALLTGLKAEGYFKTAAVREDLMSEPDFEMLRARPEFRKLLEN